MLFIERCPQVQHTLQAFAWKSRFIISTLTHAAHTLTHTPTRLRVPMNASKTRNNLTRYIIDKSKNALRKRVRMIDVCWLSYKRV